jgi:hypothetical protein
MLSKIEAVTHIKLLLVINVPLTRTGKDDHDSRQSCDQLITSTDMIETLS